VGNLDADSAPSLPETTAALLARTQAGDLAARERLASRYRSRLSRVAHGRIPRSLRPLIDTDDIVQSTLVRALDHVDGFTWRHEGSFLGYLRAAVLNQIRDQIRRAGAHSRAVEREDLRPPPPDSPLERLIGVETLEVYEEALRQLSPEQADAVVMRIEMEFTYLEIAEALGKSSPNAARMVVARALAKMAELIRGREIE